MCIFASTLSFKNRIENRWFYYQYFQSKRLLFANSKHASIDLIFNKRTEHTRIRTHSLTYEWKWKRTKKTIIKMSHTKNWPIEMDVVQSDSDEIGNTLQNDDRPWFPAKILRFIAFMAKSCIKCNINCTFGHYILIILAADRCPSSIYLYFILPRMVSNFARIVWLTQTVSIVIVVQSTYQTQKSIGKYKSSWNAAINIVCHYSERIEACRRGKS